MGLHWGICTLTSNLVFLLYPSCSVDAFLALLLLVKIWNWYPVTEPQPFNFASFQCFCTHLLSSNFSVGTDYGSSTFTFNYTCWRKDSYRYIALLVNRLHGQVYMYIVYLFIGNTVPYKNRHQVLPLSNACALAITGHWILLKLPCTRAVDDKASKKVLGRIALTTTCLQKEG